MLRFDRSVTPQESKAFALTALQEVRHPIIQDAAKFFVAAGCKLEGIYDHGDEVRLKIPGKTPDGKTIEIKLESFDADAPSFSMVELSRIDCGKYGGTFVRSFDKARELLTDTKTNLYVEFFDGVLNSMVLTNAENPKTKLLIREIRENYWAFNTWKSEK